MLFRSPFVLLAGLYFHGNLSGFAARYNYETAALAGAVPFSVLYFAIFVYAPRWMGGERASIWIWAVRCGLSVAAALLGITWFMLS